MAARAEAQNLLAPPQRFMAHSAMMLRAEFPVQKNSTLWIFWGNPPPAGALYPGGIDGKEGHGVRLCVE